MSGVKLKTTYEIELMAENGKILAEICHQLCNKIKPGMTTRLLDIMAVNLFAKYKAIPAFLNYRGFPASICVSVNEEIVHGIPSESKILNPGDIVSVDLGIVKNGYFADMAKTVAVVDTDNQSKRLMKETENVLMAGIQFLKIGSKLGEYTNFVESYIKSRGMFVFDSNGGHGIGEDLHEEPYVPNCGNVNKDLILKKGMVLAIEPLVNIGTSKVTTMLDGWTVVTADKSRSAHFEHTVAITEDGPRILTLI